VIAPGLYVGESECTVLLLSSQYISEQALASDGVQSLESEMKEDESE